MGWGAFDLNLDLQVDYSWPLVDCRGSDYSDNNFAYEDFFCYPQRGLPSSLIAWMFSRHLASWNWLRQLSSIEGVNRPRFISWQVPHAWNAKSNLVYLSQRMPKYCRGPTMFPEIRNSAESTVYSDTNQQVYQGKAEASLQPGTVNKYKT